MKLSLNIYFLLGGRQLPFWNRQVLCSVCYNVQASFELSSCHQLDPKACPWLPTFLYSLILILHFPLSSSLGFSSWLRKRNPKPPLRRWRLPRQNLLPVQTTETIWVTPNWHTCADGLDRGVTFGMTYSHLYLIILLKSLPQTHLHNIQYVYCHVSLRRMHGLIPASTEDDMASLSMLHPNPQQKESTHPLSGSHRLQRPFPDDLLICYK